MKEKVERGQFYTVEDYWLTDRVLKFIKDSGEKTIYDPFAGTGEIFSALREKGYSSFFGLDVDEELGWEINDSLVNIPKKEGIIVTNPPYLAKQSASRKGLNLDYFKGTTYDDLYLIAIERVLEAGNKSVLIVPESFINSNFKDKDRLSSITIIEENPFVDTECPVCVLSFVGRKKGFSEIGIYKGENYLLNLEELEKMRLTPKRSVKIKFNDIDGWLALRAVDSTDPKRKISFSFREELDYDFNKRLKVSSRHMTLIDIKVDEELREAFIEKANKRLEEIREKSNDVLLTPFKGNRKDGVRRRRLDFKTARAILEETYREVLK